MTITYLDTHEITPEDLSRVFMNSGIKRPYQDLERLQQMIHHADIVITAWADDRMVGIARALTDYSYCCYLSDLAVDREFQQHGIGKELVRRVQDKIGEQCSLVLISAPTAVDYYPKIGFTRSDKAFVIARNK